MPWGNPSDHHDFEPQRHDDGYIEVIGFTMTSLVNESLYRYNKCYIWFWSLYWFLTSSHFFNDSLKFKENMPCVFLNYSLKCFHTVCKFFLIKKRNTFFSFFFSPGFSMKSKPCTIRRAEFVALNIQKASLWLANIFKRGSFTPTELSLSRYRLHVADFMMTSRCLRTYKTIIPQTIGYTHNIYMACVLYPIP